MRRLFVGCYSVCPLSRLFVPRRRRSSAATTRLDEEEGGVYGSVAGSVEMSDLAEGLTEPTTFDGEAETEMNGNIVEPFDPALDHFRVIAQFSPQKGLLIVSVIEAAGDGEVPHCNGAQTRIALLCADRVLKKHTAFASGPNPKFNETFAFKTNQTELDTAVLRLRLYRKRLPKRSQLIGEAFLKARKVGPHSQHLLRIRAPMRIPSTADRAMNPFADSALHESPLKSAVGMVANGGRSPATVLRKIARIHSAQLLVSLHFSDEHGTFRIGIVKTAQLDKLTEEDGRPMECYFQMIVRLEGVELCRHRSRTINAANECDLEEFVVVPTTLRDLHEVTVVIGLFVVHGFLKRRSLLGWVRLGADEAESADAAEHWMEMVNEIGTKRPVERWHSMRRPKSLTL